MKNKENYHFLFREFKRNFFKKLNDFLSNNSPISDNIFTDYLLGNGINQKEINNILALRGDEFSKARAKEQIINSLATPDWNDLSDGDLLDEEIEIFNYEEDKSTLNTSFSGTEEVYDLYEEANLLGTDLFEEIQK